MKTEENDFDNFFVFGDDPCNEDFRKDLWKRKQYRGPIEWGVDLLAIMPPSWVPADQKVFSEYNPEYCSFTFDDAKTLVIYIGSQKLYRSTFEKGTRKNNGSTSSAHRRQHFPSPQWAQFWAELFVKENGKVQTEHGRSFRFLVDRDELPLESIIEKNLGHPQFKTIKGKLIPTDDEKYRLNFFDKIQKEGQFSDEQMQILEGLWRDIERGVLPGTGGTGLHYTLKKTQNRLAKTTRKEGRKHQVVRTVRHRSSDLRDMRLEHERLSDLERGIRYKPKCDICEIEYPDDEAGRAVFEVAHKKPISQGERETKIEDLALNCGICHNIYSYYERKQIKLGLPVRYNELSLQVAEYRKENG